MLRIANQLAAEWMLDVENNPMDRSFVFALTISAKKNRISPAHAKSVSSIPIIAHSLTVNLLVGFHITFSQKDVAYCRRNVIYAVVIGILYFRRVRALPNLVEISFVCDTLRRDLFWTSEQTVGYE